MGRIKETLVDCTESFATFSTDEGINGISIQDAEIITNFFEIMIKLNADKNLTQLLNAYKQIPDSDFLSLIESYNQSFEGVLISKNFIINIKNQFIGSIEQIYSFNRYFKYDSISQSNKPYLLINKTENLKIPYANTEIKFNTEEELDDVFFIIREKLEKHSNIIFI